MSALPIDVDAMRNATYALLELAKTTKRALLTDRLHIIKVAAGEKPGATVQRGLDSKGISPGVKNRSFSRSLQGRIHGGPGNAFRGEPRRSVCQRS